MIVADPTDYSTWDLRELEERWASTRAAIEKAARRIDLGGMRRTRHPVEYEWLASRGRLGPFDVPPAEVVAKKETPTPFVRRRQKRG